MFWWPSGNVLCATVVNAETLATGSKGGPVIEKCERQYFIILAFELYIYTYTHNVISIL